MRGVLRRTYDCQGIALSVVAGFIDVLLQPAGDGNNFFTFSHLGPPHATN